MAKSNTATKLHGTNLNTRWLRNAMKSIGVTTKEVMQDIAPNLTEVAVTGAQTSRDVVSTLRSNRANMSKVNDTVKSNKYVKLANKAFKNALSDLKAGNFNNTDRMLGMGDDEFNFDSSGSSSGGYSLGEDDQAGVDGQNVNVNINNGAGNEAMTSFANSSRKQTEAIIKTNKASMDTFVAVSSANMFQMEQANAQIISHLNNISNSLSAMVQYNNENMTKFIESSLTYYEKMGSKQDNGDSGSYTPDKLNATDVFNNSKGGINMSQYKNYVKQQLKETLGESGAGMLSPDMLEMAVSNPMGFASKGLISWMVPNLLKNSIESVEKTFSSFMPTMLNKLADWADDYSSGAIGILKRNVGKAFGLRVDKKDKIQAAQINKGAIPFDGETKHAITEIITKELREQTAYLKAIAGKNKIDTKGAKLNADVWDYNTNKYIKVKDTQDQILSEIHNSVTETFKNGDFGKELQRLVTDATDKDGNALGEDDIKSLQHSLDGLIVALSNTKSNVDPLNRNSDSEYMKVLDYLKQNKKNTKNVDLIDQRIQNMHAENPSAFRDLSRSVLSSKQRRNDTLKDIEENPGRYNLWASGLNNRDDLDKLINERYLYGEYDNTKSVKRGTKGPKLNVQQQEETGGGLLSRLTSVGSKSINNQMEAIMSGNSKGAVDEFMKMVVDQGKILMDSLKKNLFEPMKKSLFGEKDENGYSQGGIFSGAQSSLKDFVGTLKWNITGKEWEDSKGNKHEKKEDSVFGILSKMGNNVKNGIMDKLFGEKKEDGKRSKEGILGKVTNSFKEGLQGWKDAFLGKDASAEDKKELEKKLSKTMKERFPSMGAGASIGAGIGMFSGTSILGTMIGGPFGAAALGAVGGFLSKSEKFQTMLFGEKDEETGERLGGIISRKTQKFFKDHKGYLTGGAAIGAGANIIGLKSGGMLGMLVGGPVAGAITGLASSIVLKSDTFKEFLFGSEKSGQKGLINAVKDAFNKHQKSNNSNTNLTEGGKLFGMSAIGAGAGALTAGIIGKMGLLGAMVTPFGPIGGAFAGLGLSIMAQGKNIKTWLFGEDYTDEKGNKKHKHGIIGQFGNLLNANIFRPLVHETQYLIKDAGWELKNTILMPLSFVAEAMSDKVGEMFAAVKDDVKGIFNTVGKGIKDNFLDMLNPVLEPIGKTVKGVTEVVTKSVKTVALLPFNALKMGLKVATSFVADIFRPVKQFFKEVKKVILGGIKKVLTYTMKGIGGVLKVATSPIRFLGGLAARGVGSLNNKLTGAMKRRGMTPIDWGTKEGTLGERFRRAVKNSKVEKAQLKADRQKTNAHDKNARLIAKYTKNQYSSDTEEARDALRRTNKRAWARLKFKVGDDALEGEDTEKRKALEKEKGLTTNGMSMAQVSKANVKELSEEAKQVFFLQGIFNILRGRNWNGDKEESDVNEGQNDNDSENNDGDKDKDKSSIDKGLDSIIEQGGVKGFVASSLLDAKQYFTGNKETGEKGILGRTKDFWKGEVGDGKSMLHNFGENMKGAFDKSKENIEGRRNVNQQIREHNKNLKQQQKQEKAENKQRQKEEKRQARQNRSQPPQGGQGGGFGGGFGAIDKVKNAARSIGKIAVAKRDDIVDNTKSILSNAIVKKLRLEKEDDNKVYISDISDKAASKIRSTQEIHNNNGGHGGGFGSDVAVNLLTNPSDKKPLYVYLSDVSKEVVTKFSEPKESRLEQAQKKDEAIDAKFDEAVKEKAKVSLAKAKDLGTTAKEKKEEIDKEEEKAKVSDIKKNTEEQVKETKKHHSLWSSIFSKKGLIAKGLLLASPLIIKAVNWLMDNSSLFSGIMSGLGTFLTTATEFLGGFVSKVGEVLSNFASGSLKDILKHFLNKDGTNGETPVEAAKAEVDNDAKAIKALEDGNIPGAIGTFVTDENGELNNASNAKLSMMGHAPVVIRKKWNKFKNSKVGKAVTERFKNAPKKHNVNKGIDEAFSRKSTNRVDVLKNAAKDKIKETKTNVKTKVVEKAKGFKNKIAEKSNKIVQKADMKIAEGAATISTKASEKSASIIEKNAGKSGIIDKVISYVSKFFKMVCEKFTSKAAVKVTEGATANLLKGVIGGIKKGAKKIITKAGAILGATAALASTVVGLAAKESVWVTLGAINGLTGASRLFQVDRKYVDGKMILLAGIIGGFEGSTVGSIVDVVNEVVAGITQVDFVSELACSIYNACSSDEDKNKLQEGKDDFYNQYTDYKNSKIKDAYDKALADGSIDPSMTFEQYQEEVKNGNQEVEYKSFIDYNNDEHQTLATKISKGAKGAWDKTKEVAGKAWDATKKGAGAVVDGVKGAWNGLKKGAGAVVDGVKKGAGAVVDGVKGAWNGLKEGAGAAWDKTKEVASNAWNGVKDLGTKAASALDWLVNKEVTTGFIADDLSYYDSTGQHYSANGDKMDVIPLTTLSEMVASGQLKEGEVTLKERGIVQLYQKGKQALADGWNTVVTKGAELWEGAKKTASDIWGKVTDGVSGAINATHDFFCSHNEKAWYKEDGSYYQADGDGFKQFNANGDIINESPDADTVEKLITSGHLTEGTAPVKSGISKAWDDIKKTASDVWTNVQEKASAAWDTAKKTASDIWGKLTDGATTAIKATHDFFCSHNEKAWYKSDGSYYQADGSGFKQYNTNGDVINDNVDSEIVGYLIVTGQLTEGTAPVKSTLSKGWDKVKETASNLWNDVTGKASAAWEATKTFASNVWDKVSSGVGGALDTAHDFFCSHTEKAWFKQDGSYYKADGDGFKQYNQYGDLINDNVDSEIVGYMIVTGQLTEGEVQEDSTIKQGLDSLIDKAKGAWSSLCGTAQGIFDTVKTTGGKIWDSIKTKGVLGTLDDFFKSKTDKVYFDPNGNYYKMNGSGKYDYYNANNDVISENIEAQTVQDKLTAGLLTEGTVQEDSEAKKAVDAIKDKVKGVWESAKTTVANGLDSFVSWITGGSGSGSGAPDYSANPGRGIGVDTITGDTTQNGGNGTGVKGQIRGGKGGEDSLNGFTYFSQNDSKWASNAYNEGQDSANMANTGCGPTAMSMVASQMTGREVEPTEMASLAKSTGNRDKTGTNWKFIDRAAGSYGLNTTEAYNPSADFINSQLEQGKPMVLSGSSGGGFGIGTTPYTPAGHYVVAVGKDENGNVIVNDPRGKQYSGKYSLDKVASQTGAAWSFDNGGYGGGYGKKKKKKEKSKTSEKKTDTTTNNTNNTDTTTNTTTGTQTDSTNNTTGTTGTTGTTADGKMNWMTVVKTVKKAIADKCQSLEYSQSGYVDITVDGKTEHTRRDCSGYVSACLVYYGVFNHGQITWSGGFSNESSIAKQMQDGGFTKRSFSSWDDLKEGDIVCQSGAHVEIFSHNDGGSHYVYSNGCTSGIRSSTPTKDGGSHHYETVWSPPENGSGSVMGDGTATTGGTSSSSSSGSDIISKIGSFFGEVGSRAIKGALTGNYDSDYTSWWAGNQNTSTDGTGTTTTGGATPSSFPSYQLSDSQLTELEKLVSRETGGEDLLAARQEASQIANLNEVQYGRQATGDDLYKTVHSGWYGKRAIEHKIMPKAAQAVKEVLLEGKRVLPRYVVEHDMFPGDIQNPKSRSEYKVGDNVDNIYKSHYKFYNFFGKNGKGD